MTSNFFYKDNLVNLDLVSTVMDEAVKSMCDPEEIFRAIEDAMIPACEYEYGNEVFKVSINRNNGTLSIFRVMKVVADEDGTMKSVTKSNDGYSLISVSEATKLKLPNKIGEFVMEQLPSLEVGRRSAKNVKETLTKKLQQIVRRKQYNEFKDRVGEIISGNVKRLEPNGGMIVHLGGYEAYITRYNLIRGEIFRPGDRIKAIIDKVQDLDDGYQITLSRSSKEFLCELISQEVQEIDDDLIEIKLIAREAGSRSKVAVYALDHNIDPVGACIGIRGCRIMSVVKELGNEKIDIVEYSNDRDTFIKNIFAPLPILRIFDNSLDIETEKEITTIVMHEHNLNIAIGIRGQNVKLASILLGTRIELISEDMASEHNMIIFNKKVAILMEKLDVVEVIAQLLVSEGFEDIESVCKASIDDLSSIEGFDLNLSQEIQKRAIAYEEKKSTIKMNKIINDNSMKSNISDKNNNNLDNLDVLMSIKGVDQKIIQLLSNNAEFNNLIKIADCGTDDIIDVFIDLDRTVVGDIILYARYATGMLSNDDE